MRLIFTHLRRHGSAVTLAILIKLAGTLCELALPSILEHIIDVVVPLGQLGPVIGWGALMFAAAWLCRTLNVAANVRAVDNAHKVSFEIRQELFEKTIHLDGEAFDRLGLPSLISRMTSDSYNVQSAAQQLQTLCVRAPMMLCGGVLVAALMDLPLTCILLCILPFLIAIIFFISSKGIPMFRTVQAKLDTIVRIMRENITGIRVVKALSKEETERERFAAANADMTNTDIKAVTIMSTPGPLMQLCLNIGLSLVVLFGAYRVNQGQILPGVILAFLTYFNMIAMGVMGVSRIFVTMSRASASADRIAGVLETVEKEPVKAAQESAAEEAHIVFSHVDFSYGAADEVHGDFAGEERELAVSDITFSLQRGESLGIIGPTGCGKSTIVSLLMHFYDADAGEIFVDGRNVASYPKQELRRKFGTVFQNDMIFMDTLEGNIDFGRNLPREQILQAVRDSMAEPFIEEIPEGLSYEAAIKGANLSGGQKQRIYVARALAGRPEILILDDSSSALDYKTDSAMRGAILKDYPESTLILIAQRVSSVMNLDHILVLDNGKCIGYGKHGELLESCPAYREIYQVQMGSME